MTNGLKAKTNFDYTKQKLRKLLQNDEDVHEADLSEDEFSSNWAVASAGHSLYRAKSTYYVFSLRKKLLQLADCLF